MPRSARGAQTGVLCFGSVIPAQDSGFFFHA